MSDHSRNAASTVRGARLAVFAAGLVPLAGLLAACGGGGGGSDSTDEDLIVVQYTPTNGQETLGDMSDPGLDGKLTVRFTTIPRVGSMIDGTNDVNGLTPNVQILDQTFARVAGQPSLDSDTNSFTFTPVGGQLDNAQYTLTLSRFVSTPGGRQLNLGIEDFSTSWCVGPDVYPPVVRNVSPAALQSDTPLFAPIVITFNESIDPVSVVYGQTVFVQDGGTNPPAALSGTLALKRDGFDLVFTPDICIGMPPSTTIVVRLSGVGNTSYIRDKVGNGLIGDPTNNFEYSFQFDTKGSKPFVNALIAPFPGSPFWPGLAPAVQAVYATTSNRVYAYDVNWVTNDYALNFTYKPELTQQVLAANIGFNVAPPPVTAPYGGDFDTQLGRCGEGVLDYRWDGTTGQSYMYMIDEVNQSVAIINTGTSAIEGHFRGIGSPRGIGITGPFATGLGPTVFVSNFGQSTLTGIPISNIQPGVPICTAVQELNDNPSSRLYMSTGRNPAGVAVQSQGVAIGAVVNQADNDVQFFDPRSLKPVESLGLGVLTQKYPVGEGPIDVNFSQFIPGVGQFALIVGQGGEQSPTGSASIWWNSTGGFIFTTNTGGIQSTIQDGLNVPGRPIYDWFNGLAWWVPNTAGDDLAKVDIVLQGGFIWTTILLKVNSVRSIGDNPTKISYAGNTIAVASLAGQGQVAVFELLGLNNTPALYNLPGVRSLICAFDQ